MLLALMQLTIAEFKNTMFMIYLVIKFLTRYTMHCWIFGPPSVLLSLDT